MKVQYLKHNEIDKRKWDECVEHSFNHLPYCYSWYLDAVSPKWDALVAENYEMIFPLTQRRKARVNYLYQPYFTQQLGLSSKKKFSSTQLDEFISSIPEKYKFIEINLNTGCFFDEKNLGKKKLTHHLWLDDSYEKFFKRFSENTKRNIRKAEKTELIFSENGDEKTLIKIFKHSVGKKSGLNSSDYKMLEKLMRAAMKKNCGTVFEARNQDGKIQAALFLLSSKNIFINLFNASTDEGKKNSAMFFLFNEIIKLNSNTGKIFDFEGSEIPEVARFYKGFGGAPAYYPHIRINRLHWSLKWLKK